MPYHSLPITIRLHRALQPKAVKPWVKGNPDVQFKSRDKAIEALLGEAGIIISFV